MRSYIRKLTGKVPGIEASNELTDVFGLLKSFVTLESIDSLAKIFISRYKLTREQLYRCIQLSMYL